MNHSSENGQNDQPKKISPDDVEIIGTGVHGVEAPAASSAQKQQGFSRGVQVVNMGPLGLLLIPVAIVLLPVIFIGLIFLLILATFLGRSVFKVIRFKR